MSEAERLVAHRPGRPAAHYDSELEARASRPLGTEREQVVREFVDHCLSERRRHVLEVGCGGGRDGRIIAGAGLGYTGIDLSPVGARICRDLGLRAVAGSATSLPFADGSFDAGWTMSTLMHLPDEGMQLALGELARVITTGGVLEVGVWGADTEGERVGTDGRYFRHRTDASLQRLLGTVGEVEAFEAWEYLDEDGAHYQWARLRVGGPA
jgi:SAM-dependent methyltransferase